MPTPLSLLALLLPFSFPPHVAFALADDNTGIEFIRDTCDRTSYNDFCVSILQSHPDALKADLKGLLVIAMIVAQDNVTNTAEHIRQSVDGEQDAFIQQCLNDCLEHYMDAVAQIEDSLGIIAFDSDSYNDVKKWMTAAMSDSEACEKSFKEQPGHNSALSRQNGDLYRQCSIVLSLLKLLSSKHV